MRPAISSFAPDRARSERAGRLGTASCQKRSQARRFDPIAMEVFSNRLLSITEDMGNNLIRSSFSTNIKERRDCSVGLFDGRGRLICQASHIPLHLGSLLGGVTALLEALHDRGDAGGRRLHLQRPVPRRRHASVRYHDRHAGLLRRQGRVLHRQYRPPFGRRRLGAGLDRRRRALDLRGGHPHSR